MQPYGKTSISAGQRVRRHPMWWCLKLLPADLSTDLMLAMVELANYPNCDDGVLVHCGMQQQYLSLRGKVRHEVENINTFNTY